MNTIIKHGLLPHIPDKRDYKLGNLFSPTPVPAVDFLVADPDVLDQDSVGAHFACTAFATCVASGIQEKTDLAPEYTFMKSHYLAGDETDGPLDLRTACKSHVKYGALDKPHCTYRFQEVGSQFVADWKNWSSDDDKQAFQYKKKAYLIVD